MGLRTGLSGEINEGERLMFSPRLLTNVGEQQAAETSVCVHLNPDQQRTLRLTGLL